MNSPVVLIQQKNKFYDFIIYRGKKKTETPRNRLKCVSHTDDAGARHGAPLRSHVIQMRHARAEPLTQEPTQICKFISVLCFEVTSCLFTLLIPIEDSFVELAGVFTSFNDDCTDKEKSS